MANKYCYLDDRIMEQVYAKKTSWKHTVCCMNSHNAHPYHYNGDALFVTQLLVVQVTKEQLYC